MVAPVPGALRKDNGLGLGVNPPPTLALTKGSGHDGIN